MGLGGGVGLALTSLPSGASFFVFLLLSPRVRVACVGEDREVVLGARDISVLVAWFFYRF